MRKELSKKLTVAHIDQRVRANEYENERPYSKRVGAKPHGRQVHKREERKNNKEGCTGDLEDKFRPESLMYFGENEHLDDAANYTERRENHPYFKRCEVETAR